MNHLGKHVIIDITNFFLDKNEAGPWVLNILRESIRKSSYAKEVHHKLVLLGDRSPPGFTSVVLIDESHITCHCYSDKGLLAIDIFTCGNSDPIKIMNYIISKLKKKLPNIMYTSKGIIPRFILENTEENLVESKS